MSEEEEGPRSIDERPLVEALARLWHALDEELAELAESSDAGRAAARRGEAEASPFVEAGRDLGLVAAEVGLGVGELVTRLLASRHEGARRPPAAAAAPAASTPRAPAVTPRSPALPRLEAARQLLVDEATARAAAAWEQGREARREAWLSFLSHEAKNPLNTVRNALWLLREHPGASGSARFLELAERGARRIEASLKELRELHRNARRPPPTSPVPPPDEASRSRPF